MNTTDDTEPKKTLDRLETQNAVCVAALYELRVAYPDDTFIQQITGRALCIGSHFNQGGGSRLIDRVRKSTFKYTRAATWLNAHASHTQDCAIKTPEDVWAVECTCGLDAARGFFD